MVGNWKPNVEDNYRATLEAEPATDGLRKMLFGMGSLSLGELAGERMKVSLEANSPEDEQDCFQRQHPQLALLRRQGHPQRLPGRVHPH
jgi:putative iron-regulated protein